MSALSKAAKGYPTYVLRFFQELVHRGGLDFANGSEALRENTNYFGTISGASFSAVDPSSGLPYESYYDSYVRQVVGTQGPITIDGAQLQTNGIRSGRELNSIAHMFGAAQVAYLADRQTAVNFGEANEVFENEYIYKDGGGYDSLIAQGATQTMLLRHASVETEADLLNNYVGAIIGDWARRNNIPAAELPAILREVWERGYGYVIWETAGGVTPGVPGGLAYGITGAFADNLSDTSVADATLSDGFLGTLYASGSWHRWSDMYSAQNNELGRVLDIERQRNWGTDAKHAYGLNNGDAPPPEINSGAKGIAPDKLAKQLVPSFDDSFGRSRSSYLTWNEVTTTRTVTDPTTGESEEEVVVTAINITRVPFAPWMSGQNPSSTLALPSGTTITGYTTNGVPRFQIGGQEAFVYYATDGHTNLLLDPITQAPVPSLTVVNDGHSIIAKALTGNFANEEWIFSASENSQLLGLLRSDSAEARSQAAVVIANGIATAQNIEAAGQIGNQLASTLGRILPIDNPLQRVVASAVIATIGENIAEIIEAGGISTPIGAGASYNVLSNVLNEFGGNLVSGGVGAISSYLMADVIKSLGLDGTLAGNFAQSAGSTYVAAIIEHAPEILKGTTTLSNVIGSINPANVFAEFVGSTLADKIYKPDTLGGQIGGAIGEGIGDIEAAALLSTGINPLNIVLAILIIARAKLDGELIGSLFGGHPQAGAGISWSEADQSFEVDNVWKKNGGAKDTARGIASNVADLLNGVILSAGSQVLDAKDIQVGSYQIKGDKFWYKPTSASDVSFSTKDASAVIKQGTFLALSDLADRLEGGDVYIKRAVDATLAISGGDRLATGFAAGNFDPDALLGNISTARDYESYLRNLSTINSLLDAESDSAFSTSWVTTLAYAQEIGLDRRWSSDWIGGWNAFLDESDDGTLNGASFAPASVALELDGDTHERLFGFFDASGSLVGILGDTIDTASKDVITGTSSADNISLSYGTITETRNVTENVTITDGQFLNLQDGEMFTIDSNLTYSGSPITLGSGLIWNGDTVAVTHSVTSSHQAWQLADGTGLTVDGEAGSSTPKEVRVAALIDGGDGDDTIHGSDLGDDLLGGDGNDTLVGGKLDDWLMGGAGNDRLFAGAANTSFSDTATDSTNVAAQNAALGVDGGNGNYLEGGDGDDVLYGSTGSDWLNGGDGNDILRGSAGGDILDGGAGNDEGSNGEAHLLGGAGSDQYIFNLGDGQDAIYDESDPSVAPDTAMFGAETRLSGINAGTIARNWAGDGTYEADGSVLGGEDAISFGVGITMRDIRLARSTTNSNDLVISLTQPDENGTDVDTGDTLTVKDWFDETRRVEWLRFADGEEIRIGDMTSFIIGTGQDDVIIGTAGADFALGGDGDDVLRLGAGDDFGYGGKGNDIVAGDDNNDWVLGGVGNDDVEGGAGNDTVFGDDGDDQVNGDSGDDILSGGKGNDTLIGGTGNDIYEFNRGDGQDTVFDAYATSTSDVMYEDGEWVNGYSQGDDGTIMYNDTALTLGGVNWDSGTGQLRRQLGPNGSGHYTENAGTDTLQFGIGIDLADVELRHSGGDLILGIATSSSDPSSFEGLADTITLKEWYSTGAQVEKFTFLETGTLDVSSMVLNGDGTDGDDTLSGTSGKDWITGGLGDDTITGGAGDDILAGNQGGDHLQGGDSVDVLLGGGGDDVLDGGAGADQLIGGDGVDIASYASDSHTGVGVRASLEFTNLNTLDSVGDVYNGIEGLEGTSRADTLFGDDGDNTLRGLAGDDILKGDFGDDTYEIGVNDGNDIIQDGGIHYEQILDQNGALDTANYTETWELVDIEDLEGATWYRYKLTVTRNSDSAVMYQSRLQDFKFGGEADAPVGGWPFSNGQWKLGATRTGTGEQVVLEDTDTGDGGSDSIQLASGVSLSDITAAWQNSGHDLKLTFATGGSVVIQNQDDANNRVEELDLGDGLAVDLTHLKLSGDGSSDGDFFVGTAADDNFNGEAGDDVLSGGAGTNTLTGGDGNDVLEGGAGVDQFDGGSDDESAGQPVPGTGAYGDTIRYIRSAAGVSVNLSTNAVGDFNAPSGVHSDANGDTIAGIENVIGSQYADSLTGSDAATGISGANRLAGLGGDDTIHGGSGDDVISGGDGADALYGDDGDDNIIGDAGADTIHGGAGNDVIAGGDDVDTLYGEDGDDIITGGAGNDVIAGGEGKNSLSGEGGDDTITAGAGDDTIDGGDGADTITGGDGVNNLSGGAGDDTITGGSGADTLTGGAGADMLQGGGGDDQYIFDAASGTDTIIDASGDRNSIAINGITTDQVWMTRSGNDLRIAVIGGDSQITVKDYYAGSGATLMHSVTLTSGNQTETLYLDHAAALISAMNAASSTTPTAMPSGVSDLLSTYWHPNGQAAPNVVDQSVSTTEDTPLNNHAVDAEDDDDQALTYAVANAAQHGTASVNSSGQWTYSPTDDWNGEDSFDISVTDTDSLTSTQHVTVTVAAVNDAPRTITAGTLQVSEAASNNATVGTISATDVDDDASDLKFSLTNDAGGRFSIDEHTGVLTLNTAGSIDYEQSHTDTVRVKVTDPHFASSEQDFTVNVLDANDAPTGVSFTNQTTSIAENTSTASHIEVADLTPIDDALGTNSFGLAGADASSFEIVGSTLYLKAGATLNYEAKSSYSVNVTVDDSSVGSTPDASTTFTLNVTDVNEAPTGVSFSNTTTSIAENTSTSSHIKVADVAVTDDALGTNSLALTGADAASFEIIGSALYLKAGVSLNYEAKSSYAVTVTVDDSGVGSTPDASQSFTLTVTDVNEAPTGLSFTNTTTSIAEDASTASHIKVADLVVSDDALGTNGFGLTGADAASFEIIGASLYLKAGATLDYETKASYSVSVTVDDTSVGSTPDVTQSFTLNVTDVDEAPSAVSFTNTTTGLAETASTASHVKMADIVVTDDALGTNTLGLTGADAASFEIIGSTLYLKAGVSLDYNTKTSYAVTVTVDDTSLGSGPELSQNFTLSISDVDTAPTAVNFSNATTSIAENTSTASHVKLADLVITDDGTGTNNLALTGADAASFEIVGSALYLKAGVTLDYETKSSYSVNVTVDDPDIGTGVEVTQGFTLTVTDVNEAPTNLSFSNTTTSLAENTSTASHIKMADLSYSDDALGTESYGLTGTDAASFEIIGSTLYLKAGVTLNYEAKSSYNVNVTVDDAAIGSGPELTQAFTLSLTDVNEAPTAVSFANTTTSIAENTSTASHIKVADINVTDDALGTNTLALTGADAASFEIIGTSVYLKAGVSLNYEAKTSYAVTVTVDDTSVGSTPDASQSFTLNVTDVNEAPTAINYANTTTSLAENTSTASHVKMADLSATDDALGTNTWGLSGADAASFEIISGVLYLKAGVTLNYEAKSSYNVNVTLDDTSVGSTPDVTRAFTLSLTDVNEAPTAVNFTNTTTSIAENTSTASHIKVADITVTDDALGTNTLALTGADASSFEIVGSSLYIKAGVTLNYEAKSSYNVTVTVDDTSVGSTPDASHGFTVNLTDVNEAPTAINYANTTTSLSENTSTASHIKMADLSATDDALGTNSWGLSGADASSFEIISGALYLKSGVTLNYEAKSSYNVNITVDDTSVGSTPDVTRAFTLSLTDVNEAPTNLAFTNTTTSIAENTSTASHIKVADLSVTDDALGTNTLGLSGTDAGSFEIVGSSLYLKAGVTLNYEAKTSYSVNVTVDDTSVGSTPDVTQSFTLSVSNVNEAPNFTSAYSPAVQPNWQYDYDSQSYYVQDYFVYFYVSASDPEGSTLTFSDPYGGETISAQSATTAYVSEDFGGDSPWVPSGPNGATLQFGFGVTVTDPGGLSVEHDYTVHNGNSVWISPVVLDLDGDGLELTNFTDRVMIFDQDGDGHRDVTGWVKADDGMLVFDRNQNGVIDDGSEISFQNDLNTAASDLEGLRAFDTNDNGFFDSGDNDFASFRIWRDLNQDGISQTGELLSLAETGIQAINLTLSSTNGDATPSAGNTIYGTTQFVRTDGSTGTVGDVKLAYQSLQVSVADAIGGLPPIILDLDGGGVSLVSHANSTIKFDTDNDGVAQRTGWFGAGEGVLALDRNGDGVIGSGAEISFVQDLPGATSDLEGLAAYDTNQNGFLDAGDAKFGDFRVWQDANQDGVSQASELKSLSGWGISAINLTAQSTGQSSTSVNDNVVHATTQFVRSDGSTGEADDVTLAYDQSDKPEIANAGPVDRSAQIDPEGAVTMSANSGPNAVAPGANQAAPAPAVSPLEAILERWRALGVSFETGFPAWLAASQHPKHHHKNGVTLPAWADAFEQGNPFLSRLLGGAGQVAGQVGRMGDQPLTLLPDTSVQTRAIPNTPIGADSQIPSQLPPIIFDLGGSGVTLTSRLKSNVNFDVDGDGIADQTGWFGATQGVLALDRNGDGVIGSGAEISFARDVPGAATDLEGLVAYDSNDNGFLDVDDAKFADFKIWQDLNQDGVSQTNEIKSLADWNIRALNLTSMPTGQTSVGATDNVITGTTQFVRNDGTKGTAADVVLSFNGSAESHGDIAPNPVDAVSRIADNQMRKHATLSIHPKAKGPDPLGWMFKDSQPDHGPNGQQTATPALSKAKNQSAINDTRPMIERMAASGQGELADLFTRLFGANARNMLQPAANETDDASTAAPAASALQQGLGVMDNRVLHMIDAMATFNVQDGPEPSFDKKRDEKVAQMLTALPDIRQAS